MTPSATNLLGLVKHLAGIELEYLGVCVGRPPAFGGLWDEDETSQHAGHADILREMIDGRGGSDHADVGDAQWWSDHVARVQRAADAHRPATS